MEENREKLHEMIDSITDDGKIEYFLAFMSHFIEKWGA
jgi:hypothetical protein